MADIDVVPKKNTHVWLWVILAIVLAMIVLAWMGAFSGNNVNPVPQSMNPAIGAGPAAVALT